MTREKELFIKILANHINGQKTKIGESQIEWDTIFRYAQKHQVSEIVYTQVKDFLPQDMATSLRQEMLSLIYTYVNREKDLSELKNAFAENAIPFFIPKGPAVATLYPIPALRTMGDIDIVVHSDDREKCNRLMLQQGYECLSHQENREWEYLKKDIIYELHDHLVYEELVNKVGQAEFFNDCWKYVNNEELEWSFHFLFLLFHISKHILNAGAGFRQFLDLAIVIQNKQIKWEWINEKLPETKMLVFAQKSLGLIERWFGVKTPLSETIDDDFYDVASEQILDNGVFGHHTVVVKLTNKVRYSASPRHKIMQIMVNRIFPPFDELIKMGQFSILKRTKLLLPFAWIQRWLLVIRQCNLKILIRKIRSLFVSEKAIKTRNDTLERWGL